MQKKRNWKTKRYLETVYEDCPNCGKELAFRIYEEATEFDATTGKPTKEGWDFVHGEKGCSCGADLLIADDYENVNIYWLNQNKMPTDEELRQRKTIKEPAKPKLPNGQRVLIGS